MITIVLYLNNFLEKVCNAGNKEKTFIFLNHSKVTLRLPSIFSTSSDKIIHHYINWYWFEHIWAMLLKMYGK